MKLRSYPILIIAALCLMVTGCDDDTVDPGPFEYPIDLEVNGSSSNVSLSWSEIAVSSFEEYIIVRSVEPIPDTPEPEVVGSQVIVARIDEVDKTTFVDFSTPFEPKIYYKIFADIGERFLMSKTVEASQPLQLVDYRTDVVQPEPDRDEILGFDRSFDIMFVYNYTDQEIKVQRTFGFNTPILRSGTHSGTDEVYAIDQSQSTLYIFQRDNLSMIRQYSATTSVTDFFYANGLFFIAYINGDLEVRTRSNFQLLTSTFSANGTRLLHLTNDDASGVEFVEIAFTSVSKYRWANNNLVRTHLRNDISGSSQLFTAVNPSGTEYIINNAGRVLGESLDDLGSLGTGLQFHNGVTYSDDGETIATVGFVGNNNLLRFFSAEGEYSEISNNEINFTPIKMWGDKGQIFTTTVIFVSGGVRSVINAYDIP